MPETTFREVTQACPIRVRREKLGMTATDLALHMGIDMNRVIRWERGYEPPHEMWEPMGEALKVEPGELREEYKAWLG